jgi:hypothetical protein
MRRENWAASGTSRPAEGSDLRPAWEVLGTRKIVQSSPARARMSLPIGSGADVA